MSEIVRLLIMVGELMGFYVFSMYVLYRHYKRCTRNNQMKKMKTYIWYAVEGNIFNIIVFTLSYPGFRFLSYNKLIMFSAIIVLFFIIKLAIFIDTNYRENNICLTIMLVSGVMFTSFLLTLIVGSFEVPTVYFNFEESLGQKEVIEEVISANNISFEKHTVYTTVLHPDRRESDERYITTSEDVFFILNENGKKGTKFIEVN